MNLELELEHTHWYYDAFNESVKLILVIEDFQNFSMGVNETRARKT